MTRIIELFYSLAYAAKEKSVLVPVASSETADHALAFKSIGEFQNTIYGAAAFFVARELYSWWKDKHNKTSERLDRIEKIVHRLEIIAELEEKRSKK